MHSARSVFRGSRRKLILAFDSVSDMGGCETSILDPGVVPEIKGVTRFPADAHEHISHASKIPTIIYYDRAGNVKAVGAEAVQEAIYRVARSENWVKAEWYGSALNIPILFGSDSRGISQGRFKLHLTDRAAQGDIPPLPLNKTVVEVFADFLEYLFKCASAYLQDSYGTGWWASVQYQIEFVLSHPNGWEGAQQSEMRRAAILAGLVPDTTAGNARLLFVTEGEASLHFAIHNGLPTGAIRNGEGVVIVDAGGGTIDVSSYCKNVSGGSVDKFDEVAAPQCHLNGSVFVTLLARAFLRQFLADSQFLPDLDHITECFDKTTKLRFRNSAEDQYTRFGGPRDNDPECNIQFGQLKLIGTDVALFFDPSVDCVVEAVLSQRRTALKPIFHVLLVGGFASSDWLFNQVRQGLIVHGLSIIRPETPHLDKAVSDGALSFHLDRFVRSRVSKLTYGTFCHIPFNPALPDHQQRLGKTFTSISGRRRIRDSFDVILPKHTQISETKEFKTSYFREAKSKHEFQAASFSVWCYRGALAEPKWKDVDPQNFAKICTIDIDLSNLPLTPLSKPFGGGRFYRLDYDVVLLFGLTEMKALIAWKQNGVERRSAAKIVYDPDPTNEAN
ncbi:hypothetical protein M413DRAFT_27963 [Hebeloma cylindrosporum]|uniref:Actin-like ATPase domain-containing protein n=1 Tax=Hebeloma cylindrosporum TaxID=76867 RepID=A0A0C3CB36_HEBCY|nr:hypothetical protein M413DRAFT_27963 [Hebeloma cylindrosporum h7]